ncbi:MAG: hypothetical protein GKR77_03375 [Legionellales bacterium]|nr:hypothetical protein [Legionellales bacterium]
MSRQATSSSNVPTEPASLPQSSDSLPVNPEHKSTEFSKKAVFIEDEHTIFPTEVTVEEALTSIQDTECLNTIILPNTTAALVLYHAIHALLPKDCHNNLWHKENGIFGSYVDCLGGNAKIKSFFDEPIQQEDEIPSMINRLEALAHRLENEAMLPSMGVNEGKVAKQRSKTLNSVLQFIDELGSSPETAQLRSTLTTIVNSLRKLKTTICNHARCHTMTEGWKTLFGVLLNIKEEAQQNALYQSLHVAPLAYQGQTNLHYRCTLPQTNRPILIRIPGRLWDKFTREGEFENLRSFYNQFGEGSARPKIRTNVVAAHSDGTVIYELPNNQQGLGDVIKAQRGSLTNKQLVHIAAAFYILHNTQRDSGFKNEFHECAKLASKFSALYKKVEEDGEPDRFPASLMLRIYTHFYKASAANPSINTSTSVDINPSVDTSTSEAKEIDALSCVATHGDLTAGAIRLDDEIDADGQEFDGICKLSLVDFEYSGANHAMWDLAYLVCHLNLEPEQEKHLETKLLEAYLNFHFGRQPLIDDITSAPIEVTSETSLGAQTSDNALMARYYLFKVIVLCHQVTWSWNRMGEAFREDGMQNKLKANLDKAKEYLPENYEERLPALEESESFVRLRQ